MEFHTWVSVFSQGKINVRKRARNTEPIRQPEMTANLMAKVKLLPHSTHFWFLSISFTKQEKCRCVSLVKA